MMGPKKVIHALRADALERRVFVHEQRPSAPDARRRRRLLLALRCQLDRRPVTPGEGPGGARRVCDKPSSCSCSRGATYRDGCRRPRSPPRPPSSRHPPCARRRSRRCRAPAARRRATRGAATPGVHVFRVFLVFLFHARVCLRAGGRVVRVIHEKPFPAVHLGAARRMVSRAPASRRRRGVVVARAFSMATPRPETILREHTHGRALVRAMPRRARLSARRHARAADPRGFFFLENVFGKRASVCVSCRRGDATPNGRARGDAAGRANGAVSALVSGRETRGARFAKERVVRRSGIDGRAASRTTTDDPDD